MSRAESSNLRWYHRQSFTSFSKKTIITCFCDPVHRFADGMLEWVIYRPVKILLLAKMLCLIAPPSRPISLLRFQICRLVTPESIIQIRFTSRLIH